MLFLVVSGASARAQAGACVNGPCVATYHNDPMRDGVNSQETILSPTLFTGQNGGNFGLLTPTAGGATGAVDGLIYAQPLYLSGVAMASTSGCSGTQNIVLVATENNSIYAFTWTYTLSATGYSFSLTQCWALNLNQPGEYAMPFTALPVDEAKAPCNNLVPQSGITSTPVVDTTVTPPVLYVVSAHQTAGLTYDYRMHAINVNSGTEVLNGSSAPYDLLGVFHTGIGANNQNQRPGLALYPSAGTANVYVAFGSFCDTTPYSGYVAGVTYNYGTQAFSPVGTNWVFDTEAGSTKHEGGIWMGGAAPAVDTAGNVYFSVANGTWNGTTTFGESVVKLATTSSGLTPVDYYTPNDYSQLNLDSKTATVCSGYGLGACPTNNLLTLAAPTGDFDLGSGGVTLVNPAGVTSPVCGANGELIAGGKEGVIYSICYSTQTGSTLESTMGGLDGCGYNCTTPSNASITACTEADPPGKGAIAQCFQGANAGEQQKNGSTDVFASPGIRGTEAFWAGTATNPENYLYVSGSNAPLAAYQANLTTGAFNPVGAPVKLPGSFEFPGVVPSISWDGMNPDTALLWVIYPAGFGQWRPLAAEAQAATPAILFVYNALPSGTKPILTELWESNIGTANLGPGAVKFTVPTVAGGLVFVSGGTPGYAPGPPGAKNVNCTAAALVNTATPTICGGMLSIYGKVHS